MEKFGPTIDLRAKPEVLSQILDEIRGETKIDILRASYYKTYYRGYDKEGYDKTYTQYDKTVDGRTLADIAGAIIPDLDRMLLEKLREQLRHEK